MTPQITWFRHSHENRNDLLRFGLMRLHYQGRVRYKELPFSEVGQFGFSKKIACQKDPRHLSFILVEDGKRNIKCLVDNEDSFALITPLIAEVDVSFCAGYNSDLIEKKQFIRPYSWQRKEDIQWYEEIIERKIINIGHHFSRIKKFVPITTNMGYQLPVQPVTQKIKNLQHRINRLLKKSNDFTDDYRGFEIRDEAIRQLRTNSLEYDIVLNDSLWGWAQHRINLHTRLKTLSSRGYKIHSKLNWLEPSSIDGSSIKNIDRSVFPILTSEITDTYELMLSKSRLAVFACGYHWGWRSIMMLALGIGIPVLTDRLLTEAYFDMNEFHIFQQEDNEWASVGDILSNIDENKWLQWKEHNQRIYDKYMSPEAVANYFIQSLS
ncbi:MAG: hypothetical protein EOO10_13625 [Chitinophagaceae bacterium]|nr:MAG: hypothetical protein EOO10_13625 [Chitinophagaceae bacterium]